MPAIITHDTFGVDFANAHPRAAGATPAERDAFLLGNQGPDPLFYLEANPFFQSYYRLGNVMHNEEPAALLAAFADAVETVPVLDKPIAQAYVRGFLCHYALDSCAHPLIFTKEYEICDAGEPGLTRGSGSQVHAVIESDLDEMVLTVKYGETVRTFRPYRSILRASDHVLEVVSDLYVFVARTVYSTTIPDNLFEHAVRSFRAVQRFFYSPGDKKRTVVKGIERTFMKRFSLYDAMAHRNVKHVYSPYDNHSHEVWNDVFSGRPRTESFWVLYRAAQAKAERACELFEEGALTLSGAHALTEGLNFSGKAVE